VHHDAISHAWVLLRDACPFHPETAAGIHDQDHVHRDSTDQKYLIGLPCQGRDGKRPHGRR
jgi:hypothetical protein